jgi:hypothetical protein
MSDITLEPCPHCKCETIKHTKSVDRVILWCPTCGHSIDALQGKHTYHEVLDALALLWNSRPLEDALQARIASLEAEVAKLNRALDVAAETLNHIACGCPKDECDTCVVSGDCTHKTVMNYADCWGEYALAEAEKEKK